jgi:hypothetical protein
LHYVGTEPNRLLQVKWGRTIVDKTSKPVKSGKKLVGAKKLEKKTTLTRRSLLKQVF